MRMISSSELYQELNKVSNNSFTEIMKTIITRSSKDVVYITSEIDQQLESVRKRKLSPVILKAIEAFRTGSIIMYYAKDPKYSLHPSMPFFKFASDGKEKVAINMTPYISYRDYGKESEIDITIAKLYALMLSAYYFLALFRPNTALTNEAIGISARIWTAIYMKVINRIINISTNKDKYNTVKYFAEMFFMRYYLDTPPTIATEIVLKDLKGNKPSLAFDIEDKLETKMVDIYSSFEIFTDTMLSAEYTGASAFSVNKTLLNTKYFINQFIKMYGMTSFLSLGAYPYFVFLIVSLVTDSYIVNKRSFDDIIKGDLSSDFNKFIVVMNKMC